jgi:hypothetical protein
MFDAMLRGWRAQQAARGLREDTIASRERLVRRFLAFINEYPWGWAGVPREPVVLPEPLAGLVLRLTAVRHGHASTGDQGTSPWLLPGGRPGQPISPYRGSERLRQIGIRPGPAHSTAPSRSPPNSPPPSSPACSASTSTSPGNAPPPATG